MKITFKNIGKVGKKVAETTTGGQNEIIPAEVYKVEDKFFLKVHPTWLRRGKIVEMEGYEDILVQNNYFEGQ
jgi:hypothetical protein